MLYNSYCSIDYVNFYHIKTSTDDLQEGAKHKHNTKVKK